MQDRQHLLHRQLRHSTCTAALFRPRALLVPLLIAVLLCLGGSWALQFDRAAAIAMPVQTDASATATIDCASVSVVSRDECLALVALYTATAGDSWTNQQHWLAKTPSAPCDWFGVGCAAGHVTALSLAANQLSGTLPITLGYLSELTTLRLENNLLRGRLPRSFCQSIANATDFSIDYNQLLPRYRAVTTCLDAVDPDWLHTQTIAPRDLTVSAFYTDALQLSWSPIPYTADGGYYEIAYATNANGPFTVHGTTADKATASYLANGLLPGQPYFFRINSYTPPHGAQQNGLRSPPVQMAGVTRALAGHVLLAAYFPADNDLSSQIRYVANRMRRGTALNPNVTVLLLADGLGADNTQLSLIKGGVITPTAVVADEWGTQELDTADPAVLTWFLRYARATDPTADMIVSLLGHGLALAPELDFGSPPQPVVAAGATRAPRDTFPPLPRSWDDTPGDVTNNSYLSTTDVGAALMAATDNGANPFKLIFFDQCFQGNLDALYEVHSAAELFVASPNYAWLVAAYDKYLLGITPGVQAETVAGNIIRAYQNRLNARHPNAILAVRGRDIPTIASAVSDLGDALRAALADGQSSRIANAVRQSSYVDTTQCGRQNLQLAPPDELIGIESFAQALFAEFGNSDPHGVATALAALRTAMQPVNKETQSGRPYLAPTELWDYQDTLTILAPLPRTSPANVAWRASIYRPDAPFTATWTLDPTRPVTVTTSLAFVRDGRWDEFLADWYQALTPTVGQWCHYMPPEQLLATDSEPLTLTVTLHDDRELALNWTPTDDESATDYWLYLNEPHQVSWTVAETVALTTTNRYLPALAAGTYQLQVLARNREDDLISQSNVVTVEIPTTPATHAIYLPLVRR